MQSHALPRDDQGFDLLLITELISSMMTNGNNDKDDEYECVRWESHVVPRATKA